MPDCITGDSFHFTKFSKQKAATAPANWTHSPTFFNDCRIMATRPASAADAYQVPDWVERNSQLFKTPPPGFDPSTVKKRMSAAERDAIAASLFKAGGILDAGMGAADVTDDEQGNINLPVGPQPGDYWRNVENHGNILVTFITTARRKSGFIPQLSGAEFTKEQAEEYARKFSAWMNEIDSYVGYIHLLDWAQQTAKNDTTDCNVILKGVSDFVVGVAGLAGKLAEAVTLRITSLVKSAASYATQKGSAVNVGFTIETTETTGAKDPIQPISYASTIMNQLADGSTLSGAKQYMDYVNAPLNDFEKSRHHRL
ncbi:hypothetical protein GOP47_0020702 [Adiantum capillus-veneris]|uniref:Uncharacterized protein n=1 Tax=Adiantum capillus-veneris TaxID=13818 RepID=A0A9D4UAG3_ADICA|nr:hypothetical protein GOP47_0020702 [Adiantum capillus-veneris]